MDFRIGWRDLACECLAGPGRQALLSQPAVAEIVASDVAGEMSVTLHCCFHALFPRAVSTRCLQLPVCFSERLSAPLHIR